MKEYKNIRLGPLNYYWARTQFVPFDERTFEEFSKSQDLVFRDDYISFMKVCNGGSIDRDQTVSLPVKRRKIKIDSFVPFLPDRGLATHPEAWHTFCDCRPTSLYDLGICEDESYFYLGVKEPVVGEVLFYNERKTQILDNGEDVDLLGDPGLLIRLSSFAEFLDALEVK